jgi:hypothetical protein
MCNIVKIYTKKEEGDLFFFYAFKLQDVLINLIIEGMQKY